MRLNRLKLLRYGRFADEELEFPKSANGTDFQLIYGPNEAGKSSARLGLEDFLFGIPNRSPYGFQYGSTNMQIGAHLQAEDEELEAIRRKGRGNTLRDPDSNEAIEDGDLELRNLLHQTNRETFQRMFSLDHERLHVGGQSMLEADDDVGRALFAATSGLLGLQETLDAWKVEADRQWAPNKSGRREYYKARDRFDEATERVRDSSVLAREWEDRQRTFEEIEKQLDETRERIKALEPRQRKLSRIRRLKAKVSRYFEIDQRISQLGAVKEFSADAMETLNGHVSKHQFLAARIEEIEKGIVQLRDEHDALTLDSKVLEDAMDIEELNERRSQIVKSRLDLPKRREELQAEETKFQLLADKLGLGSLNKDDAANRIPSREYSRLFRELITQKRELEVRVKTCEDSLKNSRRSQSKIETELNELGREAEVDLLHAAIETAQRELDGIANLVQLQRQLKIQTREVDSMKRSLSPSVPKGTDLVSFAVPSSEVILKMRDEERELEKEQTTQRSKVNEKKREVNAISDQLESFLKDEDLVSQEDLRNLRADRDKLWNSLKIDLLGDDSIDYESPRDSQELSEKAIAFEDKVSEADALADRRFENAEKEAHFNEVLRGRDRSERDLQGFREKSMEIDEEIEKFQSRWQKLWRNVPIEVADPATMITWRESRESLIGAMQTLAETQVQANQLIELESKARNRLSQVLAELVPTKKKMRFESLAEALAYSRELALRIQDVNAHRKSLQRNLTAAEEDARVRMEDLDAIEEESAKWSAEWSDALGHIGLNQSERIEQVAEKLELFDELRDLKGRIDELLENRIRPIETEIEEFEERVLTKEQREYSDLEGDDALDIVSQLNKRLTDARQVKVRQDDLSKQLSNQQVKKQEVAEEQRASTAKIDEMRVAAGAEDLETLRECIRKSDEFLGLSIEQSRLAAELGSDGDGLSVAELKQECDSVQDLDAARTEESELEMQLEEWRIRESELSPKRTEAQLKLDEISGTDEAAHAEFDRECALAEMKDAVEKYIPIRASALVLEWAIEKFRRERQGPLLKRASQIFQTLTLGSFSKIEVQVDGNKPALLTYRENTEEVPLTGLSEGSLDQLYLAMRIASIEEHIKGTETPIPFVADDLLVNFDDERATAGLKVLLELSNQCQVLFFTHHRHLVDLASKFGKDHISVTELESVSPLQAQTT